MTRYARLALIGTILMAALSPIGASATAQGNRPAIAIELVLAGFTKPVFVAAAGDGSGRLCVVEKRGLIRIVRDGQRLREPFLDLRAIVRSEGSEQGLLSVAFHPAYTANGRFFVAYTDENGDLVIAAYRVSAGELDLADADSARILLTIPKPYDDHNAGLVAFGPDGYLYISVGDGGAPSEVDGNAQNLGLLLGKILRIDIDHPDSDLPYAVPQDNPFVATPDARPEIWAYGLRNPWRFSFDRATGELFIADVGLWLAEEIDVAPAGDTGGHNYGWSEMEGDLCHIPSAAGARDTAGLTPPVFRYFHGDECAIVGGYVYRGAEMSSLDGWYLFGDFCSGRIKGLRRDGDAWTGFNLTKTPLPISSFSQDASGEIYVTDLAGGLYRIVPRGDGATPVADASF